MFHLRVSYRSRDGGRSCNAAREYIARLGKYRNRGDVVRLVVSIHMPQWAGDVSADVYWMAAEGKHTRANARTALMVVFALPRGLSKEAQDALTLRMAEAVSRLGLEASPETHRMPVTIAIHEGGGRNPHVHVLVSTSVNDRIARPKERWFRRYLPTSPERGGARRARFMTKLQWVHKIRELWARLANEALASFGLPPTLDHRSNASRGLLRAPTVHLGPRLAHLASQGVVTPRIARNQRAAKENEALAELEATIARRKEALRQIQAEAEFLEQAQHDWERADAQAWNDLLTQHPLAGNAEALRSAASLVVLEGAAGNHPALREAYARLVGSQQIREVAGKAWDVVKPRQGVWLVRPAEDTVVMLGPGYVATDATDGAGLDAAVRVAQLLPFKNAVVVTQSLLRDKVKGLLERLGLNWSLSDLDGSRKNAPRP